MSAIFATLLSPVSKMFLVFRSRWTTCMRWREGFGTALYKARLSQHTKAADALHSARGTC